MGSCWRPLRTRTGRRRGQWRQPHALVSEACACASSACTGTEDLPLALLGSTMSPQLWPRLSAGEAHLSLEGLARWRPLCWRLGMTGAGRRPTPLADHIHWSQRYLFPCVTQGLFLTLPRPTVKSVSSLHRDRGGLGQPSRLGLFALSFAHHPQVVLL